MIARDSDLVVRVEQGSSEWHAARCGIPTASCFKRMLSLKTGNPIAGGKQYMNELLAEWVVGEPWDAQDGGFKGNRWTERGKKLEPLARRRYAFRTGQQVESVGFIHRDDRRLVGCSPDGVVWPDGGTEVKCVSPAKHVSWIAGDEVPREHLIQVQGSIWVTGAEWWDFVSYCPEIEGMPFWHVRAAPDPMWQSSFDEHVPAFIDRMMQKREWLRDLGITPASAWVESLEAEIRAENEAGAVEFPF